MASSTKLSNRAVNRAGDCLRAQRRGEPIDGDEYFRSIVTLLRFRAGWSEPPQPLVKVTMGLRSMASRTSHGVARVSQRLKRTERIIDKLVRFPRMNLAQMQDIGGCRVVVPKLGDLQRLRKRIHRNWTSQIADEDDYVAKPRDSGYRAVHIVVERDGRLVEIQLRTHLQHRWAASVEHVESRSKTWTREGEPEGDLAAAFRKLGLAFEFRDRGESMPQQLADELKHWLGAFDD